MATIYMWSQIRHVQSNCPNVMFFMCFGDRTPVLPLAFARPNVVQVNRLKYTDKCKSGHKIQRQLVEIDEIDDANHQI